MARLVSIVVIKARDVPAARHRYHPLPYMVTAAEFRPVAFRQLVVADTARQLALELGVWPVRADDYLDLVFRERLRCDRRQAPREQRVPPLPRWDYHTDNWVSHAAALPAPSPTRPSTVPGDLSRRRCGANRGRRMT